MKPFNFVAALLSVLAFATASRSDEGKSDSASDAGVYETDRPGELENPFTVPLGEGELVTYVAGMNAASREDAFGDGGSAVILDTAVRFGLASRFEGVVAFDSFLGADGKEGSDSGSSGGIGFSTLYLKWNFLKDDTGDFGIALAPFTRFAVDRNVAGSSRSESGLIVPFDFDLERGWELEGSVSVTRVPGDGSTWNTQWETQASLQRTLTRMLTAYVELQLESGDGAPAWATEFGVTCRLNREVQVDLGGSVGIGRDSRGRMVYAGMGWRF